MKTNISDAAEESAADFLHQTVTNSSNVNASCVKGSDFDVAINETTSEVTIIGSMYACDNETIFALIENMIMNITLYLESDTLLIIEDTVEIVADVINEQQIVTSSLIPLGMTIVTTVTTKDWIAVIEELEEKSSSSNDYIIIIIVIGTALAVTCCILAYVMFRLYRKSAEIEHKEDVLNITINQMSQAVSVSVPNAEDQPGGGGTKSIENEEKYKGNDGGIMQNTAGAESGDV